MRRIILTFCLMLTVFICHAQDANDYIVKTKGVRQLSGTSQLQGEGSEAGNNGPKDFVGKNFRYYSLCDWKEGMKFMVIPDKYDLIVRTFCDSATEKEVSSMTLRHKIMIYKGHNVSSDGRSRINFSCPSDGKSYYYEIPYATFEDYCYLKRGVPTLAYLGDVDIARDVLKGKKLYTKTDLFCVDIDYYGDDYQPVKVPVNEEVTVKEIGVGTRSFPVKIIVEDAHGNEFYQNVALSKTNCGMREEEFLLQGNLRNTFYGSFSIVDEVMKISGDIFDYIGKIIHTRHVTTMNTKGDGRDRVVRVPKLMSFSVDNIAKIPNTRYVNLTLTELESRRLYNKVAVFEDYDETVDTTDVKKEDFFGYIFDMGEGSAKQTTQQARAAIRAGRVTAGMSEVEVILAMGEEPDRKEYSEDGRYKWFYKRNSGTLTVVFGRSGIVENYITPDENRKLEAAKKKKTTAKKK